jgi:hypothetical protein
MSKASVKSLYLHFLDEFLGTDERFSQTLEANALALINEFDVGKARIESAESGVREFATKFGIERLEFTPADPIGAMVEDWNNQADALNAIWSEGVCDMERLGPSLLTTNWSASLEQQENQSQRHLSSLWKRKQLWKQKFRKRLACSIRRKFLLVGFPSRFRILVLFSPLGSIAL